MSSDELDDVGETFDNLGTEKCGTHKGLTGDGLT
jgi:hypothetical protein